MDYRKRFMVKPGSHVDLTKWDADNTANLKSKEHAADVLAKSVQRLDELQYLLGAEAKHALLVVFQGMDAAGKDGVIRHVMTGLNPQGCQVTSFKAPTEEELAHDFLWRVHKAVPRRGVIGIFNRSHYEDVLVVRVHDLVPREVWQARYDQINQFEQFLAAGGMTVVKFFLHISKAEQGRRLRARIDDPRKQWKITPQDAAERKLWGRYTAAYEAALSQCSTEHAPWYVIPSNHKWFRNVAVGRILVQTMEDLRMKYPKPKFDVSKLKIV